MKRVMVFPSTRYQGSKVKLLEALRAIFESVRFESCLDAFGGTGSVSYLLKTLDKSVAYNDILKFNALIGHALIENRNVTLSNDDVRLLINPDSSSHYDDLIARKFSGIYYLDEENAWLDMVVQNIPKLDCGFKRSIAFWALFQACLSKRPYNLFHRRNLYVRTSEVKRSFGNKAAWDRPFEVHFERFVAEANAAVFDNGRRNVALNRNAIEINEPCYDLVYIDPPYIPERGSLTNYHEFYHFLEGMADYGGWERKIDHESRHLRLHPVYNPWCDKLRIGEEFEKLFDHFKRSILVISYREDGIPGVDELVSMLQQRGRRVTVHRERVKYALSVKANTSEVVILAE